MKKTCLVLTLGALAGLLFCAWQCTLIVWDGRINKKLSITLLNSDGTHPIPGATVYHVGDYLFEDLQKMSSEDQRAFKEVSKEDGHLNETSSNGTTEIVCVLPSGGVRSLLGKSGSFGIRGMLVVELDGRIKFADELKNLLPLKEWNLNDKLPPITVKLKG